MERLTQIFEDGILVSARKEQFLPYADLSEEIKERAWKDWLYTADTGFFLEDSIKCEIDNFFPDYAKENGLIIDEKSTVFSFDGYNSAFKIEEIDEDFFINKLNKSVRKRAAFIFSCGYSLNIKPSIRGNQLFGMTFNDVYAIYDKPAFRVVYDMIEEVIQDSVNNINWKLQKSVREEAKYIESQEYFADIAEAMEWEFNAETGEKDF